MKRLMRTLRGTAALLALLLIALPGLLQARWEREQVELENQLQVRIEKMLSRVLPVDSYLVSVVVELATNPAATAQSKNLGAGSRFLGKNRFVLPGVPEKKEFSQNDQTVEEIPVVTPPPEALVKKISITVLVSPDIKPDEIKSLREFISASVPFNLLRGDVLDIHASPLLKSGKGGLKDVVGTVSKPSVWSLILSRENIIPLVLLSALVLALFILGAFLFGPVRKFFDRIPGVLPRIGEQAAIATSTAATKAAATAPVPAPPIYAAPFPTSGNGSEKNGSSHEEGKEPETTMPFRFIREDQLGTLSVLVRALAVPQAAVVIAYLPPAWASRVMSGMDPDIQTQVLGELSQGREIPQDFLNEVEAQVKEKLPYVVGGTEWVQSVYQMTQPQTQHLLLGALSKQSPELAKRLRAKTFFFEDIRTLDPAALRLLVEEAGYPQIGLALKGEPREVRDLILRNLPEAIRDVVVQEMDLSRKDEAAINDAKSKIVTMGQRLLSEGRILLGTTNGAQ